MSFVDFFLLEDKQRHIIISLLLLIMIFLIRFLLKLHKNTLENLSYAIRDTIFIGLAKEGIDFLGFGNPQITDLLGNSIGIFIPIYVFFLLKNANTIKGNDFYKYEGDLTKYTFKKLYGIYIDLKFIIKHIFKKYILFNEKLSSKELKNNMYMIKKDIKNIHDILLYFFLFQIVWGIDFIKFVLKLPIITFFSTFGLILSPLYIHEKLDK